MPRKNIKPFCGLPILAYSIQAALKSNCFDKVIVSTEDAEIAKVAQSYGALTPFVRPQALADDYTGTLAVINHAIRWLIDSGETPEYVCTLYGTAPFVKASVLQDALSILQNNSAKEFCFGVCEFPVHIQTAFRIKEDQTIEMFQPEYFETRTQDMEKAYFDAGQFYWGRTDGFLSEKRMFSEHAIPYILPIHEVQDIDTLEDWTKAEAMYKALQAP